MEADMRFSITPRERDSFLVLDDRELMGAHMGIPNGHVGGADVMRTGSSKFYPLALSDKESGGSLCKDERSREGFRSEVPALSSSGHFRNGRAAKSAVSLPSCAWRGEGGFETLTIEEAGGMLLESESSQAARKRSSSTNSETFYSDLPGESASRAERSAEKRNKELEALKASASAISFDCLPTRREPRDVKAGQSDRSETNQSKISRVISTRKPKTSGKKSGAKSKWAIVRSQGGPCWRCARAVCTVWYGSAFGPKTECYPCYEETRRRGRKRRAHGPSGQPWDPPGELVGTVSSGSGGKRRCFRRNSGPALEVPDCWEESPGRTPLLLTAGEKALEETPVEIQENRKYECLWSIREDFGGWKEDPADEEADVTEGGSDVSRQVGSGKKPRVRKCDDVAAGESTSKTEGEWVTASEGDENASASGPQSVGIASDGQPKPPNPEADNRKSDAKGQKPCWNSNFPEPTLDDILSHYEMLESTAQLRKKSREEARRKEQTRNGRPVGGNGFSKRGLSGDLAAPRRSCRVAAVETRRRMARAMERSGEMRGGAREPAAGARAQSAVFFGGTVADKEFVGASGVGFGDCPLFDEFLTEARSQRTAAEDGRPPEERSKSAAEREGTNGTERTEEAKSSGDAALRRVWEDFDAFRRQEAEVTEAERQRNGEKKGVAKGHTHDESCVKIDPEYGRFCGVNGAFLGACVDERLDTRAYSHRWERNWMGKVLPKLWAERDPPPGGWDESRKRPGRKRRVTLEDIPECPLSHTSAVRAAERRTPPELVAEHGSAAEAAFWAVLGARRKPFRSQVEGFEFAMRALTGSVDGLGSQAGCLGGVSEAEVEEAGKGCVLAHAMGSGKTKLGWALYWWLQLLQRRRIMTLAPASVLHVWDDQKPVSIKTYRLDRPGYVPGTTETERSLKHRVKILQEWAGKKDGMLLASYETVRALLRSRSAGSARLRAQLTWHLLEAPDVALFDEAHNIRNKDGQLYQDLLRGLRMRRRVLFTGTPYNNSFTEVWNLLHFAQPDVMLQWAADTLSSQDEDPPAEATEATEQEARRAFVREFEEPLVELLAAAPAVTPRVRARAERLLRGLRALMAPILQRRPAAADAPDGRALAHTETVVSLNMTSQQEELYAEYMNAFVPANRAPLWGPFRAEEEAGAEIVLLDKETDSESDSGEDEAGGLSKSGAKRKRKRKDRKIDKKRQGKNDGGHTESHLRFASELGFIWAHPAAFASRYADKFVKLSRSKASLAALSADVSDAHSCKARFVSRLVARVRSTERVLVFGENVEPLRTIARGLARRFGWELDESNMDGDEILYIDGNVRQSIRRERRDRFNDPQSRAVVLLATVDTCDEGIELFGATRVVILAPLWNPMRARQLIGRVVRPGQTRHVAVYRLMCRRTYEEEIYARAVRKEWIGRLLFPSSKPGGDQKRGVCAVKVAVNPARESSDAFLDELMQERKGGERGLVHSWVEYDSFFT
ncbi:hypothetical protein KFL_005460070 [Klebsormidium nitens]|uniref:Uncharacterized protein n=1 Tax=Klebsormidium nitens TaxID=105231 RepID=A0A1Y1IM19_KLENI|nr:hypothetical protein KFL_005460070 [Klebsormidium nitens]|eukprot:GAQ89647.1 hypothetical protein KFL_005460070 [Klebsormidium nitens]